MNPVLSTLLTPLAFVYGAVASARRAAYRGGFMRTTRLECPVISVGNLTLGGTGKTPIVAALARHHRDAGMRVVVLSRGYRRQSRGLVLVADESGIRADFAAAGDEALWLARQLPGVAVVVAEDRAGAGLWAERQLRPDVVLLDDGFQHLALERTTELVVVDSSVDLRRQRILPAGHLRESPAALGDADVVFITRAHLPHDQVGLRSYVRRFNPTAPIVGVSHRIQGLLNVHGDQQESGRLEGRRVVALSAIGHPAQFEADLAGLGAHVVQTLRYRDHHTYDDRDLRRIAATAERQRATIVTTAKDMVRLAVLPQTPTDIWALQMEAVIGDWKELSPYLCASTPIRSGTRL